MPADNRNILHSPLLGLWLPSISQLPCQEMLLGTNGGPRRRAIHHSPRSLYSYSHSSRRWVRMHPCRDLHWLGRKTNGLALIIALLQLFLTPSLLPSPLGHTAFPHHNLGKGSQGAVQERILSKKMAFSPFLKTGWKTWSSSIRKTSLHLNVQMQMHGFTPPNGRQFQGCPRQ